MLAEIKTSILNAKLLTIGQFGVRKMRLIEAIKVQASCEKNEELKSLPPEQKERLAKLIEERVPSGLAPIDEWNEVLSIFTEEAHESDSEKAKLKLLTILSGKGYKEETAVKKKRIWWKF